MKAAVLAAFGAPLEIAALPDPVLGEGEVIVDIVAAPVTGYAAEVFSGARGYPLELPMVPGPSGVGRVRAFGPDATRLKVGDWVFCDSTVRSRDEALRPDSILQGWTYRTEAALPLHRRFHDGAYAEQMRTPTENVTRLGDIDPAEAGRWTALGRLAVPFGGLHAGDLRAGETLVVSGASGGFGGAGVAVALAMGAGRVVATGRNAAALQDLVRRLGPRVAPVQVTGEADEDRRRILEAAAGPIDMVLDFLPREAKAGQVMAAAMTLRPGGRLVLMGGLRGPGADLPLNYNWLMEGNITVRGQWMYEREAIGRLVRMISAGLIDLSQVEIAEFGLDDANEAVAHAAANAGPGRLTVLRPDRARA